MATQVRITIKCAKPQNSVIDTFEQVFSYVSGSLFDKHMVKAWLCDLLVQDRISQHLIKTVLQIMELNYKNDLEVKIKDVLEFRMKPE